MVSKIFAVRKVNIYSLFSPFSLPLTTFLLVWREANVWRLIIRSRKQSSVLFYHITGPKESSPLMYEAGEDLLWNQLVVEFLELRFAGFTSIALPAFIVSYIFFFGIGGFLHVSAYIIN